MKTLAITLFALSAAGLWWFPSRDVPPPARKISPLAKTLPASPPTPSAPRDTTTPPTTQPSLPAESVRDATLTDTPPAGDLLPIGAIPLERVRYLGDDSPDAALESWLWSAAHGNEAMLRSLVSKPYRGDQPEVESEIARALREVPTSRSFRVHRAMAYGADRMLVLVEFDGSGRREPYLMARTGHKGTWQRAVTASQRPDQDQSAPRP